MLKESFSKEGYIVKQYLCTDESYGRKTLSYGGCGAIAIYNLSKILNRAVRFDRVKAVLEEDIVLGGVLGTGVWGITKWLSHHKIDYTFKLVSDKVVLTHHTAGIILYPIKRGLGMHFVAFAPVNGEIKHFYNVSPKTPEREESLSDFIKNNSKIPFAYLISVKVGI